MKDEEKVVPAEGQAADEKGQAAPDGNEAALGAASQEEGADEEKTKQPRKGTAGRLALRFIGVLVGLAYWTLIWCQLVVFVASGRSHWFEVGILLTVVAAVALAVADRRYRKRGEEEQRRWRLREKIERALFVACISHYCRSQAMINAAPSEWHRLHIVHCGVDPSVFTPTAPSGAGARLLYVGRLAAAKGLPILLRALARLKPAHPGLQLSVVGDGPDRDMLEAMAAELEVTDCVQFLGYQSNAEVRRHLSQTEVFVMSSFAEGVPVVLMEAMAAGVAVVAPRIAGIPELIDDGRSGFLTPPGDVQTLAQRIAALLDDPELRRTFAEAGRQTVAQQFNLQKEAAWLAQVMNHALKNEPCPIRPLDRQGPIATVRDRCPMQEETT